MANRDFPKVDKASTARRYKLAWGVGGFWFADSLWGSCWDDLWVWGIRRSH